MKSESVQARDMKRGDTITSYGSGAECGFAGEVVERVEVDEARPREVIVSTDGGRRIRFDGSQMLRVEREG